MMNSSRASSLAIRSSSRRRKRVSTSVSPWCFSGGGRSDLASSVTSTARAGSARRAGSTNATPSTPIRSPRSSPSSRSIPSAPSSSTRACSWIRPERSTRSRNAILPCPRRAASRPATRWRAAVSSPADKRGMRRAHRRDRLDAVELVRETARCRRRAATRACAGGRPAARRSPSARSAHLTGQPAPHLADVDLGDLQPPLALGAWRSLPRRRACGRAAPCRRATRWTAWPRPGLASAEPTIVYLVDLPPSSLTWTTDPTRT